MQQVLFPDSSRKLCAALSRGALALLGFLLIISAAGFSMACETCNDTTAATTEPTISSVTPEGITLAAGSQVRFVRITGAGTGFRFPDSKVSFSNEAITALFTLPVSAHKLWALLRIEAAAAPGVCNVTVTTGEETAIGVGLFELKDSGGQAGKRWTGNEKITVRKEGTAGVETTLNGLQITEYDGKDCVRLSDIVTKSAVTTTPEKYFYNFIAADSFSVKARLILRGLTSGLPPWDDMKKGYIYDGGSAAGLSLTWEEDTVASKSGAGLYKVRLMQGGIIELLDYNVP